MAEEIGIGHVFTDIEGLVGQYPELFQNHRQVVHLRKAHVTISLIIQCVMIALDQIFCAV